MATSISNIDTTVHIFSTEINVFTSMLIWSTRHQRPLLPHRKWITWTQCQTEEWRENERKFRTWLVSNRIHSFTYDTHELSARIKTCKIPIKSLFCDRSVNSFVIWPGLYNIAVKANTSFPSSLLPTSPFLSLFKKLMRLTGSGVFLSFFFFLHSSPPFAYGNCQILWGTSGGRGWFEGEGRERRKVLEFVLCLLDPIRA